VFPVGGEQRAVPFVHFTELAANYIPHLARSPPSARYLRPFLCLVSPPPSPPNPSPSPMTLPTKRPAHLLPLEGPCPWSVRVPPQYHGL